MAFKNLLSACIQLSIIPKGNIFKLIFKVSLSFTKAILEGESYSI